MTLCEAVVAMGALTSLRWTSGGFGRPQPGREVVERSRRFSTVTHAVGLAALLVALLTVSGCGDSGSSAKKAGASSQHSLTAAQVVAGIKAAGLPVGAVVEYDAETDTNELLGRPHQYTEKVNFADEEIDQPNGPTDPSGGTVEVFTSEDDATARKEYVEKISKEMPSVGYYCYQDGVYLLRIDFDVPPSRAQQYEAAFRQVLTEGVGSATSPTGSPLPSTTSIVGWAVGEGGAAYVTTDGGETWVVRDVGTTEDLSGVAFADGQHGWIVGYGTILATADGGTSWEQQKTGGDENLTAVSFADANHGWASGFRIDSSSGGFSSVVLHTTDGGATWSAEDGARRKGNLPMGIYALDEDHCWVGGEPIMATIDGGDTWRPESDGTEFGSNGLAFADGDRGWAVGGGGLIIATTDGGMHWRQSPSGVKAPLNDIAVTDDTSAWVVGEKGTMLWSDDGGKTWAVSESITRKVLTGISFSDAARGCAVGDSGTVLLTTDAGMTWTESSSAPPCDLSDVYLLRVTPVEG